MGAGAVSLLTMVERHLRRVEVTPSRFGRDVAGDPRFVFDLRRGREPRPATEAKVRAFMLRETTMWGHVKVRGQISEGEQRLCSANNRFSSGSIK